MRAAPEGLRSSPLERAHSFNMAPSEPSEEVLANYQKLTQECQLLQSKIAELETERIEHK